MSRKLYWFQTTAIVVMFIYCWLFFAHPPEWCAKPVIECNRGIQTWAGNLLGGVVERVINRKAVWQLASAVYLAVLAGLIPVCMALLLRRWPRDWGWRMPNRLFIRYFLVSMLVALPFLLWMVRSPFIAAPYLKQLERLGLAAFAAYYLVNMFTEHLLLHGIVLGLSRPEGRWADPAPLPPPRGGIGGVLSWLGLASQPCKNGGNRLTAWLGLASGCIVPMLFSALLFGMVHLGKDTRELILSFPGGLAQAFIAYRTNSWATPFLIHLGTASTALAMMTL